MSELRCRLSLVLLAALTLAACGFQPLYAKRATGDSAAVQMSQIRVAPIPDRVGQQVRNHLLDGLNPRGRPREPRYRLDVTLQEQKVGLAIESDDTVSRINLTLNAQFVLEDLAAQAVVLRGATTTIAAYNLILSDYANLIAEQDAKRRATRELADEIKTRVAVYFSRRQDNEG